MRSEPDESLQTFWISLSVAHTDRINQIRDTLYAAVDAPDYHLEESPHITLHRGFTLPGSEYHRIERALHESSLLGRSVEDDRVKLWPNIPKPLVTVLDVTVDLTDIADFLDVHIRAAGGSVLHERAPPHITLFRAGLERDLPSWTGLSTKQQNRLFAAANAFDPNWTTTITDISIGEYNPESAIGN